MLDASTAVTKNRDNPFTEDDLHDYVDGRMEPARAKEFKTFLEANPDISAVVDDYRRQNGMLRALFGRGDEDARQRTNGSDRSGKD